MIEVTSGNIPLFIRTVQAFVGGPAYKTLRFIGTDDGSPGLNLWVDVAFTADNNIQVDWRDTSGNNESQTFPSSAVEEYIRTIFGYFDGFEAGLPDAQETPPMGVKAVGRGNVAPAGQMGLF